MDGHFSVVAVGPDPEATRSVWRLKGELDLEGVPLLTETAGSGLETGGRTVVLDCQDITFCDSSGLNALLRLREQASLSGARLVLARPSENVLHLLRLTHTDSVFDIVDTLAETPVRRG
ncbi:STAS domain-containing protein [Streptomyces aureocirculatus]|uniref:STAS domain-containing protein n=1 Tax=Streptomyces aureocirculatus TaxID=67275 RepID=UPI00068947DE|nr:STAS domain-containing protein [Streptomyces aureocirculatus]